MLVYVGTYTEPIRFGTGKILQGKGQGIHCYRLDHSGALTPAGVTAGVTNPSYLAIAPSRRFLYAVNELKTYEGQATGTVSAFALDAATGALRFLDRQPTRGTDPCHLTLDATGRHVLVANFMSGSVCVLPIGDDGTLGAPSSVVQHEGRSVDPVRQAGPHAHAVTLDADNRHAFVPDLGLDAVITYRFDRGTLIADGPPPLPTKAGAGPRQLVFHPGGRFAYLVNELDSTIAALAYEPATGRLMTMQVVSALPQDFRGASTCADLQVHPSGAYLYTSNRGHDSLAIHAVDPTSGRLTPVGHAPTGGRTPRSFGIDPSGTFLLAANQDSDTIVTFRIDPHSGRLHATGAVASVPTPVCVKFLER